MHGTSILNVVQIFQLVIVSLVRPARAYSSFLKSLNTLWLPGRAPASPASTFSHSLKSRNLVSFFTLDFKAVRKREREGGQQGR